MTLHVQVTQQNGGLNSDKYLLIACLAWPQASGTPTPSQPCEQLHSFRSASRGRGTLGSCLYTCRPPLLQY